MKSKEESSLLFSVGQLWNIAQALLCRCMLHPGGRANWATHSFWVGIKTKCLPHFGPVCLCCVPGPLTRCQSDTWCQRASFSNRCSAGDSCSLADWSLGTWWGVAVCAQTQSLQCYALGQRLRHACHNAYTSFCSVPYCHTNIIALWDTSLVSCDLGIEMDTCTLGTAALTGRTSSKLSLGYISDPVCKQGKSLGSFKSVWHMT